MAIRFVQEQIIVSLPFTAHNMDIMLLWYSLHNIPNRLGVVTRKWLDIKYVCHTPKYVLDCTAAKNVFGM